MKRLLVIAALTSASWGQSLLVDVVSSAVLPYDKTTTRVVVRVTNRSGGDARQVWVTLRSDDVPKTHRSLVKEVRAGVFREVRFDVQGDAGPWRAEAEADWSNQK